MTSFEEFVKSGEVKQREKNNILAGALIKSAEKRLNFVRKLEISNENAENIVENSYDIIRELIETRLSKDGYKSYSHEATILYLKKFKQFSDKEISQLDWLRKTRIGTKYYGKESNKEEAGEVINFLDKILPKLKELSLK